MANSLFLFHFFRFHLQASNEYLMNIYLFTSVMHVRRGSIQGPDT